MMIFLGLVQSLPINKPYVVETNRLQDGVSSISPFSLSSPSFPEYKGSFAVGYSTRQENVAIHQDTIKHTFVVESTKHWNPSGRVVERTNKYRAQVEGTQEWQDYMTTSSADGFQTTYDAVLMCYKVVSTGECKPYLHQQARFPDQNWMKLMCCISDSLTQVQPTATGERYLPLEEGKVRDTCFPVGRGTDFTASETGELLCFANDGYAMYWNNIGSLTVSLQQI